MSIAEFTALPIARALETARKIKLTGRDETIAGRILHEIIERLEFLSAVGTWLFVTRQIGGHALRRRSAE